MKKTTAVKAYTIEEAAEELGKSRTTIYRWLKEGQLTPIQTRGGSRLVTAESVEGAKNK